MFPHHEMGIETLGDFKKTGSPPTPFDQFVGSGMGRRIPREACSKHRMIATPFPHLFFIGALRKTVKL